MSHWIQLFWILFTKLRRIWENVLFTPAISEALTLRPCHRILQSGINVLETCISPNCYAFLLFFYTCCVHFEMKKAAEGNIYNLFAHIYELGGL